MRNMVALSSVTKPNSKRNQLLRQLGRERINSAVIICRLISLMSGRGSRLVLCSFYNRGKENGMVSCSLKDPGSRSSWE